MKNYNLGKAKPGQTVHLMGICGTAMASLAGLLKEKGLHVTGSDQNPYPPMSTQLEQIGINIMKGYRPENLNHKPDLVIVGNVISRSNPEAEELMKLDIPYTSLPKAIGEWVIEDRVSLVVSGTHGKTTTTSLMAWVADNLGKEPGFLIGGIPKNFLQSFKNPRGDYFIIEGDEYDTAFFDKVPKFVHYKPKHVILTSVEFDHADIYSDLNEVKAAFKKLIELIPENGTLIYNGEDSNILELIPFAKVKRKISYGSGLFNFNKNQRGSAHYEFKIIKDDLEGTRFSVDKDGQFIGEFFTSMTGNYNIMNSLSVISLSDQLGWSIEKVSQSLKSFQGVKRRQEIIGEPKGITIIEDFAHHPTAVRETIRAVQNKYTGRKLFAVFEPRSATSRRRIFQKEYLDAFMGPHETLIAEAFDQIKIDKSDRFSAQELVTDLVLSGGDAQSFSGADAIVSYLGKVAKAKDVILIMSNGGFDGIYQKLLVRLNED